MNWVVAVRSRNWKKCAKAETIKWNEEVKSTFLKEVDKLERMHPQSPDYSVQLNYLQTMMSLPWGVYTTDNLNLTNAEKTLNKDHYGLEKVKSVYWSTLPY